jgi:hypothetical protein
VQLHKFLFLGCKTPEVHSGAQVKYVNRVWCFSWFLCTSVENLPRYAPLKCRTTDFYRRLLYEVHDYSCANNFLKFHNAESFFVLTIVKTTLIGHFACCVVMLLLFIHFHTVIYRITGGISMMNELNKTL